MGYSRIALAALFATGAVYVSCRTGTDTPTPPNAPPAPVEATANRGAPVLASNPPAAKPPQKPLAPHVHKALDWLVGAQQADGGWGAGSSARQDIRDAHAVPTDPATTAVAAMALLRAGERLGRGDYGATLQKATDHLLQTVESAPEQGPQITTLTGTQPQAKMGQNVDTALCAQFFARLLQEPDAEAPRERVQKALDKCLRKIEASQSQDGSWAAGGWAPVLQSAQMSTALELAQLAGRTIDESKLEQARAYQRAQVSATGGSGPASTFTVSADAAAGVQLYASASNMRAVAADARAAEEIVAAGKQAGRIGKEAQTDAETLKKLGVGAPQAVLFAESVEMNTAAKARAFDENVLDGFGNNGGEEFLSYQMKSESLAIDGGDEWAKWTAKISERLAKVQNPDGSWSGHHCITSPTFCTATAISCLTAERDVEWLRKTSQLAAK